MSSDAASWQRQLGDEQPADPSAGDTFGEDPWSDDVTEALADPAGTNLFSAEIENVNASDWEIDTELIWGDDGQAGVDDGGSIGLDFPL